MLTSMKLTQLTFYTVFETKTEDGVLKQVPLSEKASTEAKIPLLFSKAEQAGDFIEALKHAGFIEDYEVVKVRVKFLHQE